MLVCAPSYKEEGGIGGENLATIQLTLSAHLIHC
jgi:hypothetical protein